MRRFCAWMMGCILLVCAARGALPGTCLQFNGTNGYVSVPHNAALNAYPLTITAWIKTARNAALYDGIVSKYPPGGFDGFSFLVWQGHVRAWYFHNSSSYIWNPGGDTQGVDGGFVADGNWHHVAFVVNNTNGTIYVDGNLGGSLAWTGSAGPPTTNTVALLLGRGFLSPSYTNTFQGQLDEVTLWNRALTPNELNYLKHRSLGGKEDGLLAYWRLDEGTNSVAGDSGPNGYNGTIVPNPAWLPSGAAVVLDPIATNCVKLNGISNYVSVAHASDLNAYPLTATAWVRTTRNAAQADGIVSKYVDASDNGYSIFLYNGHVRAWYFRDGSDYVWDGSLGIDGGFIADGDWHHVALVVDSGGGRLIVDGNQVQNLNWLGSPGATSTTYPLQFGRYWLYNNCFLGDIDEVAVWSQSFTAAAIQAMKNRPLVGNEANLVAYWRLDEGSGTSAGDATGRGHTGTLLNAATPTPLWTGSDAYLGNGSVHMVAAPTTPSLSRQYAVATGSGNLSSFSIAAGAFFRRFYDFGTAPASLPIVAHLDGGLQIAGTGAPLAVNPDTATNSFTMTAYNASSPQPIVFGAVASVSDSLSVQPSSGVQLDSVNNLHNGVVTLSHSENGGAFNVDGSDTTVATRLLHFDGNLYFGSIQTVFTSIANAPTPGSLGGGGIGSQLAVNNNSGTLTANPAYHYGNGATLNVTLMSNGDALAASGLNVPLTGADGGCLQNICYTRSGLTLSNSSIHGTITLQLPLGLGVCTNFNFTNRVAVAQLPFAQVYVDPSSLVPLPSSLTASGPLYVVEETKPFWLRTPSLTWQLNAGQIVLAGPLSALFVRQEDDDLLTASLAASPPPVNTNLVKRISNDGYYRNGSNVLSSQVT
ncbi:MAG TPA: LamG domain-containing protein, partial [Candidatus Acidoferrum sp.]|nr:LamG domain-containing protein [Candidatus Acidoferrum sp.]